LQKGQFKFGSSAFGVTFDSTLPRTTSEGPFLYFDYARMGSVGDDWEPVDDIRLFFAYASDVGEMRRRMAWEKHPLRQHRCNLRFDHLRGAAGP
jgi:hypothetical protein